METRARSCGHVDYSGERRMYCDRHPHEAIRSKDRCQCCDEWIAGGDLYCLSCAHAKNRCRTCDEPIDETAEQAEKLKRFKRVIEEAAERVVARGNKPAWKDHPSALTLALYTGRDLSQREMRWVNGHLDTCADCRSKVVEIDAGLGPAKTSAEVAKAIKAFVAKYQT